MKDREVPIDLEDIDCDFLNANQMDILVQPVIDILIYQTLNIMKKNKAPRPDGFGVEFCLSVWDITGQDFYKAVKYFFNANYLHKGIKSAIIALIPKVPTSYDMTGFRPISLCNIAYKCIAKILVARMKR